MRIRLLFFLITCRILRVLEVNLLLLCSLKYFFKIGHIFDPVAAHDSFDFIENSIGNLLVDEHISNGGNYLVVILDFQEFFYACKNFCFLLVLGRRIILPPGLEHHEFLEELFNPFPHGFQAGSSDLVAFLLLFPETTEDHILHAFCEFLHFTNSRHYFFQWFALQILEKLGRQLVWIDRLCLYLLLLLLRQLGGEHVCLHLILVRNNFKSVFKMLCACFTLS